MRLQELVSRLQTAGMNPEVQSDSNNDFYIEQLTSDSRLVGSKGLFVAIRGSSTDGHLFIDKAVNNGAIAIVHEATPGHPSSNEGLPNGVASVRVQSSSTALGVIASALCGDPADAVDCIGVTGTNGKTTTSFLIHDLLESAGQKCGLIGTIEYRAGRKRIDATHTTPDAIALQKLLAEMREDRCKVCSMEVSSHALAQSRVAGVDFRVAVFTNLTRDHIDYHGTMLSYRDAKKRLFDNLSGAAAAVTNVDDPSGHLMVADTPATVTTYGQSDVADVHFEILENSIAGLTMTLDGRLFTSGLVGRFNAYNLAACYATAVAYGVSPVVARRFLQDAQPVPGRFERIKIANGPTAIVDYAHTPDALENVLSTARELSEKNAKVVCVFGCGGDRDATKRPMMGAIAERLADLTIVTNDNPRSEDPEKIFSEIRAGIKEPDDVEWCQDREAAIRSGVNAAGSRGIVVIAGKGHETYQINGTERKHFDDREVVRNLVLRKR